MGYGSISGRARTDVNNPTHFKVCDRCGLWYNGPDLQWQYDYRGRTLANLRILVCETCLDDPQPQLKPRIIPPDPLPIANARVEPFAYDNEDDRGTSNPALPNVDLATMVNTTLSGYQFVDGFQVTGGELILVMNQTDKSKNGIYKVSSGVWALQGFDNDRQKYFDVYNDGSAQYWELGYNYGAVNVARGATNYIKLRQIIFGEPDALLSVGAPVYVTTPNATNVNHYDFYTGIYMAGCDERVTQLEQARTTQQTGFADGSLNEVPGFSNLVPGACDMGRQTEAPYGNAVLQGYPSGFDELPFAGAIWPLIQNTSIPNWLNYQAKPSIWVNYIGIQLTFNNYDWPQPGPNQTPWRPIEFAIDQHDWYNDVNLETFWENVTGKPVDWRNGAIYGVCPPGGEVLFLNAKCDIILLGNNSGNNVNVGQIYPNGLPQHIYPNGGPLYIPDVQ